jgi:hypothetical protein
MGFVKKLIAAVVLICVLIFAGFYGISRYNAASFGKGEMERARQAGLLKKVDQVQTLPQGTLKIDAVIADATDFTVFYSLKSWKGVGPDITVVDDLGQEYKYQGGSASNKTGLYRFEPIKPDVRKAVIRIASVEGNNYDVPVEMDFSIPYQRAKLIEEGQTKELANLSLTVDRLVLGVTKTLVEITAEATGEETGRGFLQMDNGLKNNEALNPIITVNGSPLEAQGGSVNSSGGTLRGVFAFAPVEGDVSEVKLNISNIPLAQEIALEEDIFANDIVLINKKVPNGEGYFYIRRIFNTPNENTTQIYYDVEGKTWGEKIIASQFYDGQKTIYEGMHREVESNRAGNNLIVFANLPRKTGKYKLMMAFPQEPITFTYNL